MSRKSVFKTLVFFLVLINSIGAITLDSRNDHRFLVEGPDVFRPWGEVAIILNASGDTLLPGYYLLRLNNTVIKWDISNIQFPDIISNLSLANGNQDIRFHLNDTLVVNDSIVISSLKIYNQISTHPSQRLTLIEEESGDILSQDIYTYWIGKPGLRFDEITHIYDLQDTAGNILALKNVFLSNGTISNSVLEGDTLILKLTGDNVIFQRVSIANNAYFGFISRNDSLVKLLVKSDFTVNDSVIIDTIFVRFLEGETPDVPIKADLLPTINGQYIFSIQTDATISCGNPAVRLERDFNYVSGDRSGRPGVSLDIIEGTVPVISSVETLRVKIPESLDLRWVSDISINDFTVTPSAITIESVNVVEVGKVIELLISGDSEGSLRITLSDDVYELTGTDESGPDSLLVSFRDNRYQRYTLEKIGIGKPVVDSGREQVFIEGGGVIKLEPILFQEGNNPVFTTQERIFIRLPWELSSSWAIGLSNPEITTSGINLLEPQWSDSVFSFRIDSNLVSQGSFVLDGLYIQGFADTCSRTFLEYSTDAMGGLNYPIDDEHGLRTGNPGLSSVREQIFVVGDTGRYLYEITLQSGDVQGIFQPGQWVYVRFPGAIVDSLDISMLNLGTSASLFSDYFVAEDDTALVLVPSGEIESGISVSLRGLRAYFQSSSFTGKVSFSIDSNRVFAGKDSKKMILAHPGILIDEMRFVKDDIGDSHWKIPLVSIYPGDQDSTFITGDTLRIRLPAGSGLRFYSSGDVTDLTVLSAGAKELVFRFNNVYTPSDTIKINDIEVGVESVSDPFSLMLDIVSYDGLGYGPTYPDSSENKIYITDPEISSLQNDVYIVGDSVRVKSYITITESSYSSIWDNPVLYFKLPTESFRWDSGFSNFNISGLPDGVTGTYSIENDSVVRIDITGLSGSTPGNSSLTISGLEITGLDSVTDGYVYPEYSVIRDEYLLDSETRNYHDRDDKWLQVGQPQIDLLSEQVILKDDIYKDLVDILITEDDSVVTIESDTVIEVTLHGSGYILDSSITDITVRVNGVLSSGWSYESISDTVFRLVVPSGYSGSRGNVIRVSGLKVRGLERDTTGGYFSIRVNNLRDSYPYTDYDLSVIKRIRCSSPEIWYGNADNYVDRLVTGDTVTILQPLLLKPDGVLSSFDLYRIYIYLPEGFPGDFVSDWSGVDISPVPTNKGIGNDSLWLEYSSLGISDEIQITGLRVRDFDSEYTAHTFGLAFNSERAYTDRSAGTVQVGNPAVRLERDFNYVSGDRSGRPGVSLDIIEGTVPVISSVETLRVKIPESLDLHWVSDISVNDFTVTPSAITIESVNVVEGGKVIEFLISGDSEGSLRITLSDDVYELTGTDESGPDSLLVSFRDNRYQRYTLEKIGIGKPVVDSGREQVFIEGGGVIKLEPILFQEGNNPVFTTQERIFIRLPWELSSSWATGLSNPEITTSGINLLEPQWSDSVFSFRIDSNLVSQGSFVLDGLYIQGFADTCSRTFLEYSTDAMGGLNYPIDDEHGLRTGNPGISSARDHKFIYSEDSRYLFPIIITNGELDSVLLDGYKFQIRFPDSIVSKIEDLMLANNDLIVEDSIKIDTVNNLIEFECARNWLRRDTLMIRWVKLKLEPVISSGQIKFSINNWNQYLSDSASIVIGNPSLRFDTDQHIILAPDSLWFPGDIRIIEGDIDNFLEKNDTFYVKIPSSLGIRWSSYPLNPGVQLLESQSNDSLFTFVFNTDVENSLILSSSVFKVVDLTFPARLRFDVTGEDGNHLQLFNGFSEDTLFISLCKISSTEDDNFIFHDSDSRKSEIVITENGRSPSLGSFRNTIYLNLPVINGSDTTLVWSQDYLDSTKVYLNSLLLDNVSLELMGSTGKELKIEINSDEISQYSIVDTLFIRSLYISEFNDTTTQDSNYHLQYSLLSSDDTHLTNRWHNTDSSTIQIGQPKVFLTRSENFIVHDIPRPLPELKLTDAFTGNFIEPGDTLIIRLHNRVGSLDTGYYTLDFDTNYLAISFVTDSSLAFIVKSVLNQMVTIRNLGYYSSTVNYDSLGHKEYFSLYVNGSRKVFPFYSDQINAASYLRTGLPTISMSGNSVFVVNQPVDSLSTILVKDDPFLSLLEKDTIRIWLPPGIEGVCNLDFSSIQISPGDYTYFEYDTSKLGFYFVYPVNHPLDSIRISNILIKDITSSFQRKPLKLSFSNNIHIIDTTFNTIRAGNTSILLQSHRAFRKGDTFPRTIGTILIKEDGIESAINPEKDIEISLGRFHANWDDLSIPEIIPGEIEGAVSRIDSIFVQDSVLIIDVIEDFSRDDSLKFSVRLKDFFENSDSSRLYLDVINSTSFFCDSTRKTLRIGNPEVRLIENRTYFKGDHRSVLLPDIEYKEDSLVAITDTNMNCIIFLPDFPSLRFDTTITVDSLGGVSSVLDSVAYYYQGKGVRLFWKTALEPGTAIIISGFKVQGFSRVADFDTIQLSIVDNENFNDSTIYHPEAENSGVIGICDIISRLGRNQLYFTTNEGINNDIRFKLPVISVTSDTMGASFIENINDSIIFRIKLPGENKLLDFDIQDMVLRLNRNPIGFWSAHIDSNMVRISIDKYAFSSRSQADTLEVDSLFIENIVKTKLDTIGLCISPNETNLQYYFTDTTSHGIVISNPSVGITKDMAYCVGDPPFRDEIDLFIIDSLFSTGVLQTFLVDTLILILPDSVPFEWNDNVNNGISRDRWRLYIPLQSIPANSDTLLLTHPLFKNFLGISGAQKIKLSLASLSIPQRITERTVRVGNPKIDKFYDEVIIKSPEEIDTLHKIIISERTVPCIVHDIGINFRIPDSLNMSFILSDSLVPPYVKTDHANELIIDSIYTEKNGQVIHIQFNRDLLTEERIEIHRLWYQQLPESPGKRFIVRKGREIYYDGYYSKNQQLSAIEKTEQTYNDMETILVSFNGMDTLEAYTHVLPDTYRIAKPQIYSAGSEVFIRNYPSRQVSPIIIEEDPDVSTIKANRDSLDFHEYNIRIKIHGNNDVMFDSTMVINSSVFLIKDGADTLWNRVVALTFEDNYRVLVLVLNEDFQPGESVEVHGVRLTNFRKRDPNGFYFQYALRDKNYVPFATADYNAVKYISAPSIDLSKTMNVLPDNVISLNGITISEDSDHSVFMKGDEIFLSLDQNSAISWDTTMNVVQIASDSTNTWMKVNNNIKHLDSKHLSLQVINDFDENDKVIIYGLRCVVKSPPDWGNNAYYFYLSKENYNYQCDTTENYIIVNPLEFIMVKDSVYIKNVSDYSVELPTIKVFSHVSSTDTFRFPHKIWLVIPDLTLPVKWDLETLIDSVSIRIGNSIIDTRITPLSPEIIELPVSELWLKDTLTVSGLRVKNLVESSKGGLLCVLDGYNRNYVLRTDTTIFIGAPIISMRQSKYYEIHDILEYLKFPVIEIKEDESVVTLLGRSWWITLSDSGLKWDLEHHPLIDSGEIQLSSSSRIRLTFDTSSPGEVFTIDSLYLKPFNRYLTRYPVKVQLSYSTNSGSVTTVDSSREFIENGEIKVSFQPFHFEPDLSMCYPLGKVRITQTRPIIDSTRYLRVWLTESSGFDFDKQILDSIGYLPVSPSFLELDSLKIKYDSTLFQREISDTVYLSVQCGEDNAIYSSENAFSYNLPFFTKKPYLFTENGNATIKASLSKAYFNHIAAIEDYFDLACVKVYNSSKTESLSIGNLRIEQSHGNWIDLSIDSCEIDLLNKWYQHENYPCFEFVKTDSFMNRYNPEVSSLLHFIDPSLHIAYADSFPFWNDTLVFFNKLNSVGPGWFSLRGDKDSINWFFGSDDTLEINNSLLYPYWKAPYTIQIENLVSSEIIDTSLPGQSNLTIDSLGSGIYRLTCFPGDRSYYGIPIVRMFVVDNTAPDSVRFLPLQGIDKDNWGHYVSARDVFRTIIKDNVYTSNGYHILNWVSGDSVIKLPNDFSLIPQLTISDTIWNGKRNSLTLFKVIESGIDLDLASFTRDTAVHHFNFKMDSIFFESSSITSISSDPLKEYLQFMVTITDLAGNISSYVVKYKVDLSGELLSEQFFNYPNPFSPANKQITNFCYIINRENQNKPIKGKLIILDASRQPVYIVPLTDVQLTDGIHNDGSLVWNGKDAFGNILATGVYFAILKVEKQTRLTKIYIRN